MEDKTIIVKQGGGFGTFLKGVLFGAAIAFLFAPRSGEETRSILSEKGTELRDKAAGIARDTRTRAEYTFHDVRSQAENILHDTRNKIQDRVEGVKVGLTEGVSDTTKELKRELEITEDINNRSYPL